MQRMAIRGIDTTHRGVTGAEIKAAGFAFVCRYVSNSPVVGHTDKEMLEPEIREKSAAGVRIVSNFEWGEQPADTVANGKAHARAFLDTPAGRLCPDWAPCYYSLDWNNPAGAYVNYAHGWADVVTPERAATYGNGACYRELLRLGLMKRAWQSKSLSYAGNSKGVNGFRIPVITGATIVQFVPTVKVGGIAVDENEAKTPDYGGWLLGEASPNGGSEVELLDKLSTGETVDAALVTLLNRTRNLGPWLKTELDGMVRQLDALGVQTAGLVAAVNTIAAGGTSVDTQAVIAAIGEATNAQTATVSALQDRVADLLGRLKAAGADLAS